MYDALGVAKSCRWVGMRGLFCSWRVVADESSDWIMSLIIIRRTGACVCCSRSGDHFITISFKKDLKHKIRIVLYQGHTLAYLIIELFLSFYLVVQIAAWSGRKCLVDCTEVTNYCTYKGWHNVIYLQNVQTNSKMHPAGYNSTIIHLVVIHLIDEYSTRLLPTWSIQCSIVISVLDNYSADYKPLRCHLCRVIITEPLQTEDDREVSLKFKCAWTSKLAGVVQCCVCKAVVKENREKVSKHPCLCSVSRLGTPTPEIPFIMQGLRYKSILISKRKD